MPESYNDQMSRLFVTGGERLKRNSASPHILTFQVTEDCTLRCSYCYQAKKTDKRMSLDMAKKIVDMFLASDERMNQYYTASKMPAVILDFIGGEPMLEIELIDHILDYFVEQAYLRRSILAERFMASMASNGTLYFTPQVQAFLEKWRGKLSISFSIDGSKELHDACRKFPDGSGSYDIAVAAAKDYMARFDATLPTKMTIAPGNVQYLRSAINELFKTGYQDIFCNCVFEEGWTLEHAHTLYEQLKGLADDMILLDEQPYVSIFDSRIGVPMTLDDDQNWCGGVGLMLAADYAGRFFPCIRYMESSLNGAQEPYCIGDIEHGIMNTEEHKERVKCLDCITRISQSTEECINCPIARGCAWCSGYNYQVTGTANKRVTYICPMHKARVLANVYYWNKLHEKDAAKPTFPLFVPREWAVAIVGEEEYEKLKEMAVS